MPEYVYNKEESEHVYNKEELVRRFDAILDKTLGSIDNIGIFTHVREFNFQKGVAGAVIEQCVLEYPPDTRQEADIIVEEGTARIKTELKTTGIILSREPRPHFIAKEPMSITAVGIYDLANQSFWKSHFWEKLEHMLIVYYYYDADHAVVPFEYRNFPVKGYEFHEFDVDDIQTLRQDWEYVHSLVTQIVSRHSGECNNYKWRQAVEREYIWTHGQLRRNLSYIDLAPMFPPRFRLKRPVVNTIISRHFGYKLEQLPGRYTVVSDIDKRCAELTQLYAGQTIGQLAHHFNIQLRAGEEPKSISEQIAVAMFGGTSKKLNQIELFERFGLIAKTIVITESGKRTEDMKLFHVDFNEMLCSETIFEDSELYAYFAEHELLCIIFEQPKSKEERTLSINRFIGFKRLVFGEDFIHRKVYRLWEDTRRKVFNGLLEDEPQYSDGRLKTIGSGEISSAPNFLKSYENAVFMRGSGTNSSSRHKTEVVNGIYMLPQYVWIKGTAVVDELYYNR